MIEFKEMQPEQILTMEKLAQEIWREYSPCFITTEQIEYMLSTIQSKEAMQNQLNENYEYYFIYQDKKICGYFAIQNRQKECFLSKLYIKKEFRHIGIGKTALNFIKNLAKKANLNKIQLTVNKNNNTTIKAYLAMGFKNIKSEQFDIGNGYIMDDYIFELKI